jgi:hypothetical protein
MPNLTPLAKMRFDSTEVARNPSETPETEKTNASPPRIKRLVATQKNSERKGAADLFMHFESFLGAE